MKIYVAIVEDRHSDVVINLFSTQEKAVAYAHHFADKMVEEGWAEDLEPEDAFMIEEDMAADGLLFYSCYSTEGDCVYVKAYEVDAEDTK